MPRELQDFGHFGDLKLSISGVHHMMWVWSKAGPPQFMAVHNVKMMINHWNLVLHSFVGTTYGLKQRLAVEIP